MVTPVCELGLWVMVPTLTMLLQTLGILTPNSLVTNRGLACDRKTRGFCVLWCMLPIQVWTWLPG